MIPLKKSKKDKEAYCKWYLENEEELKNDFTDFLEDQKQDWIKRSHKNKIREFLLKTLHVKKRDAKCAYCERKSNFGGGYPEVEHFYPKKTEEYKDRAFDFDNLLLSCKQCNNAKGQRYKNREGVEILNPYNQRRITPHLALNLDTMAVSGISSKGKATVEILNASLNESINTAMYGDESGAIYVRQYIKDDINLKIKILRKFRSFADAYIELKALLEMIDEKEMCTATKATVILNHPYLKEIMESLEKNDVEKHNELKGLVDEKKNFCLSANKGDGA